ncbi:hypothetical protein CDAR_18011 [Caerostris darwini]|uniref:Uncharacterized protein n=1 Tax=Caerostris darwini TaxID=1538125 RepID=A0AAV4PN01_9ARAC|nr:hypothetical protein CDAR_18011 [Caerostris darwini]
MKLSALQVFFIISFCILLYVTRCDGILAKKFLRFLFQRRNVVLLPIPIPFFRKGPVREASIEWQHKEVLPPPQLPPPDYFLPPPPPPPPFYPPYGDMGYPFQ